MIVLAIETSGPRGSVAIIAEEGLVSEQVFQTKGQLGAELTPAIDKALKAAGLSHDVPPDLIAVDLGPGSYTGIRVGLAAAKGLAFGWGRPLVGVSSLHAMAAAAPPEARRIAAVMDARRGEVYAGVFERRGQQWQTSYAPGIVAPRELVTAIGDGPVTLMGNAAAFVRLAFPKSAAVTVADEDFTWPKAENIARIGERLYQKGRLDSALSIAPVYMRPTAPEVAAGRKRRRSHKSG